MADDDNNETNLIDQLANTQLGEDNAAQTETEATSDTAFGNVAEEDPEAAAKRRAKKKLEKTDWKKKTPEELFAMYDVDGSGSIDFEEFKAALPQLGQDLSEAKAFKYFRQW